MLLMINSVRACEGLQIHTLLQLLWFLCQVSVKTSGFSHTHRMGIIGNDKPRNHRDVNTGHTVMMIVCSCLFAAVEQLHLQPGVAYPYNLSMEEAKAGGSSMQGCLRLRKKTEFKFLVICHELLQGQVFQENGLFYFVCIWGWVL